MNEATRSNLSALIGALWRGGSSVPEIAQRLGISESTVRRIKREDGITRGR